MTVSDGDDHEYYRDILKKIKHIEGTRRVNFVVIVIWCFSSAALCFSPRLCAAPISWVYLRPARLSAILRELSQHREVRRLPTENTVFMKFANRILLFALVAVAALPIGTAAAASLEAPEELGLHQLANNIYISPEMSGEQIEQAVALVDQARERVRQFYGEPLARPKIVICATHECYCEFGAVGLGFTDGKNLVISPQGLRVTIIAHELAHVEFTARVGSFAKVLQDVPQWFDEGQAVMISMAEEFSETAWREATADGRNAPPLTALAAMDDWTRLTGAGGEHMQFTYGTAHQEVGRWFEQAGTTGLQALPQALHNGETFAAAYARIGAKQGFADASVPADRQASAERLPILPGVLSWNFIRAAW